MAQHFTWQSLDSGWSQDCLAEVEGTCTVELGAQPVSARAVRFNTKTMTEAMQCKSFSGACYHCDMPGHSQNQCPIRRCTACQQYGHSARWCPTAESRTTTEADPPLWMRQ